MPEFIRKEIRDLQARDAAHVLEVQRAEGRPAFRFSCDQRHTPHHLLEIVLATVDHVVSVARKRVEPAQADRENRLAKARHIWADKTFLQLRRQPLITAYLQDRAER
jgi:hypothetical protein